MRGAASSRARHRRSATGSREKTQSVASEIPEHGSRCEIPDGHRCPYALCRSGERIAHCDSGTWVVSDEGSCATLPEARCPFEAPLVGAVCEEGTPTCAYACDGGIEHFRCEAGRFVEEQACAPHGP